MAAIRLQIRWFGVNKGVASTQKYEVADMFEAESKFVSLRKKLLDTRHPAWKKLVSVRGNIVNTWRNNTLPFPEPGIRLIRRRNLEVFGEKLKSLRDDLLDAERELDNSYAEMKSAASLRLGRLYDPSDYPDSVIGLFDAFTDHPNVTVPDYLRAFAPNIYEEEAERVRTRFDDAVKLAEDAFFSELSKLIEHLTERISGTDDGKPKIFRDSVVTNLVEFFERFRRLNIGSSEDLDRMVARVRQIVGDTTADDLRNNSTLRQHVATELSRVQSRLDGLMVDRPRRNLIRRNGGANANRD